MAHKILKVKDVAEQLNVSAHAVRLYTNNGELRFDTTPKGHRVFRQEYVDEFLGITPDEKDKITVFYTRSSNGDKALMDTQEELLTEAYGMPMKLYSDKASGLSEKRRGLKNLIRDAKKGKFDTVCVTEKDRLTRFGYQYIEDHLDTLGVTIEVLGDSEKTTLQEELMKDFMSLIASFSGKFYRLRGYEQQRRLLKEAGDKIDG